MKTVNEVLSRFYKQPIVAGYTNTGWPVIRPANNLTGIIAGGFGKEVPSAVANLLKLQSQLHEAIEKFDAVTKDLAEAETTFSVRCCKDCRANFHRALAKWAFNKL